MEHWWMLCIDLRIVAAKIMTAIVLYWLTDKITPQLTALLRCLRGRH